ncbi:MAG: methyltransferase domain-containing protein [Clostridia bacterium]|nr:methyltransferase domain-containing protein [Clostridia bacterium]
MINDSSNEIWKAPQSHSGFENRSFRFTEEMRPLFYRWLGISPDSYVLDAGCGTGVFARYLAAGMEGGHVDGFDINAGFIEYGRKKLEELGLSARVTLTLDDGFHLSYADNTYDAVTNYTYIGVLSDPVAGLREMIRVCKPGGVVSCVVATNAIPPVSWQGDYPFEGADELQRLSREESYIFSKFARKLTDLHQSEEWHAMRYPKMFDVCGLKHIAIHPFAYTFHYLDEAYSLEYRRELLKTQIQNEIGWLDARYHDKKEIYAEHGFDDRKCARLLELLRRKLEYVEQHLEHDRSFEWIGGFNFIVTGIKDGV